MKSLFVVFLAVTAVTADIFCKPRSQFKDDCNWCTCSPDGTLATCTDIECPKHLDTYSLDVPTKQQLCEPGKTFKRDDYSTCTCSKDGATAECTLGLNSALHKYLVKEDKYCTPGTIFSPDNCNTCKCTEDGTKAVCTLSLCHDKKVHALSEPKQVCDPLTQFQNYCNDCFCDKDGLTFACTRMWCDEDLWNKDGTPKQVTGTQENTEVPAEKQVCQPRSTFKNYCNTCFCSEDGLTYACTRMRCDKDIWNQDGSLKVMIEGNRTEKQVCQPRSSFKKYCNTCFCAENGLSYACTRMGCDKDIWNQDGSMKVVFEEKRAEKQVCQPRSTFKNYCNTCFCAEDGLSYACTRMGCDKDIWNQDGSLKVVMEENRTEKQVCQPRSSFKNYCNTCFCTDDGMSFACTRMWCDTDLWNQNGTQKEVPAVAQEVCTPNTQFKEYCNTCMCSVDGLSKACTLVDCDKNIYNKDGSLKSDFNQQKSDSDRVCEPHSIFSPDGCNSCVCNEYGNRFACTYKLCLTGLQRAYADEQKKTWGPLYKQGDACSAGKLFYSECNQCICSDDGRSAFCTAINCEGLVA